MPPKRIISLVPSQTELLFDLGLDQEVAGITKFCLYPAAKISQKPIVGGTKTVNLEQIRALQPDLILANKEENSREQIEALQQQYVVHVTDVATLPDALAMIREVGTLVGKAAQANRMAQQIEVNFAQMVPGPNPSVAYFIWRNPHMVAANHTFIHAMLEAAGFTNVFAHLSRYPEITPEELQAAQPEWLFLSSEPYPFAEKHRAEMQRLCPNARLVWVDGELFSWYGSRLLRSSDYFRNLRNQIAQQGL